MVMRLHLRKCGKTRGRVAQRSGSVAGARAVRYRDAFAAADREPALQLRDAELELRDHRRFVGRKRLRDEMHCRLGILIRHARSLLMYTVAKMFFPKREQHNVGRRRGNGNRRELGDHDVAGEVDTGGLENALSGQVVRDVRGATTFLTFSVASFLLPHLLAHLLLSECRSMRWLCRAPNNRGSERDGRQWPSVGRASASGSQRGRTAGPGAERVDLADACEAWADTRRARRKRSRASAAATAAVAATLSASRISSSSDDASICSMCS